MNAVESLGQDPRLAIHVLLKLTTTLREPARRAARVDPMTALRQA